MAERKSEVFGGSPPTDRAVSVVELLVDRAAPCTIAEVADALGLSRSTVAAILSALDERGWVSRLPDLRYQLGPRLAEIADAAQRALHVPAGLREVLGALSTEVECGASLSLVSADELTFMAMTASGGRALAGITTGTRLPLRAPAGAGVVAFADSARQQAWLAGSPDHQRAELAVLLEQIRATGVGVWGIDAADAAVLDVLAEVVEHLAESRVRPSLHEQVLALLGAISGRPYTEAELADATPHPMSYLVAPVFAAGGEAVWELQIGPMRSAVPRDERLHYIDRLAHAARELDMRPRPG